LLAGLDGVNKMSKSLGNYIGVAESAGEIFGKVMSISDELMWRYFSLVLCLAGDEVRDLQGAVEAGKRHPRDVKDELARRVAAKFHDQSAADAASREFARVFSERQVPEDVREVAVAPGRIGLVGLLVRAKLASSNSEARRLVQQGAVEVAEQKITDPKAEIEVKPGTIIRCGKRGFVRIAT
jgi:tyrosyl-tRNA synthetase